MIARVASVALAWPMAIHAQTLADGLDFAEAAGAITTTAELGKDTAYTAGYWRYDGTDSHDGSGDSVVSVLPNNNQLANSLLTVPVTGPAVVSFWWKFSGQKYFDSLSFYGDDSPVMLNWTSNNTWQKITTEVGGGLQNLSWLLERNASKPENESAKGWVDDIQVTPIPNVISLQRALELIGTPSFPTVHSRAREDGGWYEAEQDDAVESLGVKSVAKSGDVAPGERSSMYFSIQGPAELSFDWGITSDGESPSKVDCRLNGAVVTSLSGDQGRERRTLFIRPGLQQIRFDFTRYLSSEEYEGVTEAFVDDVRINSFSESPDLANAVDRPSGAYSLSWTRDTTVSHDGVDSAKAVSVDANSAKLLYVELPPSAGLFSFWSKTDTDDNVGFLSIYVDGNLILQRTGKTGWAKTEMNLQANKGGKRLLEAYFYRSYNVDGNSPNTSAHIDQIAFAAGQNNYQPDLAISQRGKAALGQKVYNRTAARQTATIRARERLPIGYFTIRCTNRSATDSDKMTLRGTGDMSSYQVFFVVKSGKQYLNYTAAFRTGKFSTMDLGPGKSEAFELWMAKKPRTKKMQDVISILGKSKASPAKVDLVRAKLIVQKEKQKGKKGKKAKKGKKKK